MSKQADLGASVVVLNCHLRVENWTRFRIHGGGLGFVSFLTAGPWAPSDFVSF